MTETQTSMSTKKLRTATILFVVLVLIDQIVKIWVKTNMMLGESIWITDWFQINFQENNGMAFSIELFDKIFLTLFRMIAVVVLIWFIRKSSLKGFSYGLINGMTMVAAGALGNIIDCVFYGQIFSSSVGQVAELFPEQGGYESLLYGKVVDMLYFPLVNGTFPDWMPWCGGERFIFFRPVFNFADASICVGVFYLLLFKSKELQKVFDSEDKDEKSDNGNKSDNNSNESK